MPSPKSILPKYSAPYLSKGRSRFDLGHTSHFDFYHGQLTPVDTPMLVIPGDTFDLKQRTFIRMTQPLKVAPFDTIQADVHYFFVPMRLVYDQWNDFITGNNGTNWNTFSGGILSQIAVTLKNNEDSNESRYPGVHGLLDYLGLPPHGPQYNASDPSSLTVSINSLMMKGYYLIWNWFYRFEPLFPEVYIDKTLTNDVLDTSQPFIAGIVSNKLCPVMKLPDYFSRALPQPTRGPEVTLDLSVPDSLRASIPNMDIFFKSTDDMDYVSSYNEATWTDGSGMGLNNGLNLYATVSGLQEPATGFNTLFGGSINGLREAFVLDKIMRIDALYGARIGSYTKGHYGVTPPEIINQPEYLGGHTFDINVNQVVQTSDQGSGNGELGEIGGYSFTKHEGHYFTKSFTEFGYIFGLINTRIKHHSYAQGVSNIFKKLQRLDYWLPEMSNMSDQSQYAYELYISSATYATNNPPVFGYQERGWEYKNLESRVAGYMRPQVNQTLSVWTYTDNYSNRPYLSTGWIEEPISAIDRSIDLGYTQAPPFIAHIFFDTKAYRVMPYHSIPGELTHSW